MLESRFDSGPDPNALKRLQHRENVRPGRARHGLTEHDLDDPGREEILREIELELSRTEGRATMLLDRRRLSPEQTLLLEDIEAFIGRLTAAFREKFMSLLSESVASTRSAGARILDHIAAEGLAVPAFTIYDHSRAADFLGSAGLRPLEMDSRKSLLLVFNLPKPLAHFWWKGGRGDLARDVRGAPTEWGRLYREVMPAVWQEIDQSSRGNGLAFKRLNAGGQHDPGRFYYAWEMSRP